MAPEAPSPQPRFRMALTEELNDLYRLYQQGALTSEEYNEAKSTLIRNHSLPSQENGIPSNSSLRRHAEKVARKKDRFLYVFLALVFGEIGVHNYYSGHVGRGLLKAFVLFLFVITEGTQLSSILLGFSSLWIFIEICAQKTDVNGWRFK
jgi:TM2 domain-containing membrane protein YozV